MATGRRCTNRKVVQQQEDVQQGTEYKANNLLNIY